MASYIKNNKGKVAIIVKSLQYSSMSQVIISYFFFKALEGQLENSLWKLAHNALWWKKKHIIGVLKMKNIF